MLIKPDFSDVQDTVGAGEYKCRILNATIDKWAGKDGKPDMPYVNWTLTTFGEQNDKNNDRRIFYKTPIVGKAAYKLQQFYKAAMKQELTGKFDGEMLYGKEVSVTVIDGMDRNGNLTGYTEVKSVRPLSM